VVALFDGSSFQQGEDMGHPLPPSFRGPARDAVEVFVDISLSPPVRRVTSFSESRGASCSLLCPLFSPPSRVG